MWTAADIVYWLVWIFSAGLSLDSSDRIALGCIR